MQTFLDLLKSSTLIQGTMALATTGAVIWLFVAGRPVPDTLVGIATMILGYYFGTKQTQAQYKSDTARLSKQLDDLGERINSLVETKK